MSKNYILLGVLVFGFLIRFIYFLKTPDFDYTHLGTKDPFFDYPLVVSTTGRDILPSESAYFKECYSPRDSQEYKLLALNLIKERKFSWNSEPVTFRTPVYPTFIATIYLLFGIKEWMVMLFQVFLSTASIYLIYLISRNSVKWSAPLAELSGILAGALFSVDFNSILFSSLFMCETLFIFLILLGTLLFLRGRHLSSGFVLGVSVLTRPIALYIFLPLCFLCNGFKKALFFMGLFFLPILPWMLRNFKVYGLPRLTSIDGWNLLFSNAATLEAKESGSSICVVRSKFAKEVCDSSNNPLLLAHRAQRIAVKRIMDSPFKYAWLHLKGGGEFFLATKSDNVVMRVCGFTWKQAQLYEVLRSDTRLSFRGVVLLLAGSEIFLVAMSIILGVISFIRNPRFPNLVFFVLLVYFFILSGGPFTEARFRFPLMPYFYLLSSTVIASFIIKRHYERRYESNSGNASL